MQGLLFALFCLPLLCESYVASVLQHTHLKVGSTPTEVKLNNLAAYDVQMARAKSQGSQLLVTPEVGLGHDELDRKKNAAFGEFITNDIGSNPCVLNMSAMSPATTVASCLARKHGMALVVGMIDLQPCSNTSSSCPKDGHFVYNTALAFDEDGTLVAKYWKYHLFTLCPSCFDHPSSPQVVSFELFNVTFGLFICFDSLFPEPAHSLLQRNVDALIFPTSWENLPPVLLATAWQQSLSRRYNITLLAANNGDGRAKSGSGIYRRGVALASHFNMSSTADVLMTATVEAAASSSAVNETAPTTRNGVALRPLCGFLHCETFRASGKGTVSLKRDNISCSLEYEASGDEYFALAIHSGKLWFGEWLDTDFCGIVKCDGGPVCLLPDPVLKHVYETSSTFQAAKLAVEFRDPTEAFFPMLTLNHGQIAAHGALDMSTGARGAYGMTLTSPQSLISMIAFGRPWN